MQQWNRMSKTLREGHQVESSDTKGHEPQDVTVRTENVVPSVEVTLSFDDDENDNDDEDEDDEDDYNADVPQRQSEYSEDCIKEKTIVNLETGPSDWRKDNQAKTQCCIGSEQVSPDPGHNTSCNEDESWHPDSLQRSRSSDISGRQMCKRSSRIKACSKCGRAFTSSADLTNHMRVHTEEDSHICGECGKDFTHYDKLKFHQENGCKERNETLMHRVKNCVVLLRRLSPNRERDFLSKDSVQTEKPVLHSNVIKPCNINSSETSTSTKDSTMKCTLCDQMFSELDLMQRHYFNSHVVNGSFQCSVCKRAFVRLCDIVRHHQKMRLYPCAICKRCFTKPSGLKRHKTSFKDTCRIPHISEEKMIHSCNIARRLNAHKNTQPIMCSYCDKKFSSIDALKVHMHRHTGGFSCPLCPKVFNRKLYLNRHMDRHNGQEPYLCEICGQGWSTQRYLDIHMIKHTDERPFKCDQCDKTFKRVNVLRLHIRSKHLDLRPYVCHVCGKAHKFSQDLKQHMSKHTGIYPHNCSRCGKGFGRLYYLKKHQETKCK
ncbi:uncharacterized protein [Eucyclogobius newberryi]|uniref:uncharacterized protein n=1 Tax=Eucyclogobius newberryi TaxID=166745 RepID=UPI003B58C5C8